MQIRKIHLKILYVTCKLKRIADTEYRLIAHFARELGREIPPTGLPTDEVYRIFFNLLDKDKKLIILILDELDYLIKKTGDELLYNLTRINSDLKNSQISIIGISNNLLFKDNLDPRVRSSLSEEELVFTPYNALQLQSILRQRSDIAFKDGSLEAGVVEKCAAYAAREHGDARRAIELLRVAAEIADRQDMDKIKIEHIDKAEEEIENNRIQDMVKSQPQQQQATLYSIISICSFRKKEVFTGDVYELYKELCPRIGLRPLTQRRISDIIAEFDMLGIINTRVISKGRYGRTKNLYLVMDENTLGRVKKILEENLNIQNAVR